MVGDRPLLDIPVSERPWVPVGVMNPWIPSKFRHRGDLTDEERGALTQSNKERGTRPIRLPRRENPETENPDQEQANIHTDSSTPACSPSQEIKPEDGAEMVSPLEALQGFWAKEYSESSYWSPMWDQIHQPEGGDWPSEVRINMGKMCWDEKYAYLKFWSGK